MHRQLLHFLFYEHVEELAEAIAELEKTTPTQTPIPTASKEPGFAIKVLEKLGLSDQIEILPGNHFKLPVKTECELFMVATAAEPKKEIFDHLVEVLPAGTKITYRIYEMGLRRVLETSSFPELPEQFKEYLRIQPEPPVNNTVVFLIKEVY